MASLIHPAVELLYNGRDVTADLSPYLMSATYTDRLSGEADDLDVELASPSVRDTRWLADWYPDKGGTLQMRYGYRDRLLGDTGEMEVDEIEIAAPPLSVRIRALSAGITRQARTRLGRAYENLRLSQIVDAVAARLGAKRAGKIEPDPLLDRVTQYQEGDWAFVRRLLGEYGYTVKLADNNQTLAVAKASHLAEQEDAATLTPEVITAWRYRDKISDVPQKVEVKHHDSKAAVVYGKDAATGEVKPADVRRIHRRARSPEDAAAQAEGEAERHAVDKTALELSLPGDPLLVAGSIVRLEGFARLDGRYLIVEARHTLSRAGYTADLKTRRLP